MTPPESERSVELVDAMQDVTGRHPGQRVAHAKGTLCAGLFTPSTEASQLTRAPHFSGGPLRAHVRFSNGSGKPDGRDAGKEGRGMAVKLYGEEGNFDIVAISTPVFFVRTPEDFLEFTRARKPDPETGQPDMERLGAFLAAHPEAQPAIQHTLAAPAPASYLRCAYNAIHAFRWIAKDGGERWVRYRWEPAAGEQTLSEEEAGERERNYLQADLGERLEKGPSRFTLIVRIATDNDPVDDPTVDWPAGRATVAVGTLEVTGLAFDRERDGDILVFDPLRLPDGIEPSEDPILHARPGAYAVSVERRAGVTRDA